MAIYKIPEKYRFLWLPPIDLAGAKRIGGGATSSVYKVERPGRMGRLVAKVPVDVESEIFLPPEAYHLMDLDGLSPHIVGFRGVGRCITPDGEETSCLVLDYIEGVDLDAFRRRGVQVNPLIALKIVRDIARAFQEIHGQKKVYCDVNPVNIMATTVSESTFLHLEERVRRLVLAALRNAGYVDEEMLSGAFNRVAKEDFAERIRQYLPDLKDDQIDDVFDILKGKSEVRAILIDFAFMREEGKVRERVSKERGMTPGYIPVEWFSLGQVDKRSDIYSLGIILYEMLTAQRAIPDQKAFKLMAEGRARKRHDKLLRKINDYEINVAREIAKRIKALLRKMLLYPLEYRFQSCDELLFALEPIIERLEQEEFEMKWADDK